MCVKDVPTERVHFGLIVAGVSVVTAVIVFNVFRCCLRFRRLFWLKPPSVHPSILDYF